MKKKYINIRFRRTNRKSPFNHLKNKKRYNLIKYDLVLGDKFDLRNSNSSFRKKYKKK